MKEAVAQKNTEKIPEISGQLGLILALWATAFKHPTFSEEREWRVFPLALPAPPQFRSDKGWLKPYIQIPLAASGSQMDLRSIIHAPTPDPTLAKRSLNLLLSSYPELKVDIQGSSAPLRV